MEGDPMFRRLDDQRARQVRKAKKDDTSTEGYIFLAVILLGVALKFLIGYLAIHQ